MSTPYAHQSTDLPYGSLMIICKKLPNKQIVSFEALGGGQTTALHAAWRSSEMTWKQMAAKNNRNLSSGRETSSGGGRAAQCRGSQSVLPDVPLWLQLYIYILLGLPDRLKFFQGSFVILWLLKFYFMPILNAFWIYWRSKFFQTNIYE